MLKGRDMTLTYGRGRANVKNFLDSAFSQGHLLPQARLEQKVRDVLDRSRPLHLTYFGRLTRYKGIDHMLRAVRKAHELGANLRASA